MAEPFIGEIKILSFSFPPRGWALCNGQTLPIAQNTALFSLLGVTYGGNGTTTFQLPNFQGRTGVHSGNGFAQGQMGGVENVTLLATQLPAHQHAMNASSNNSSQGAANNGSLPTLASGTAYAAANSANGTISPTGITGGNQPHPNMQPYLVLNFSIALVGVFPSRN